MTALSSMRSFRSLAAEKLSLSPRWWTISRALHLPAMGCAPRLSAGKPLRAFMTSVYPAAYVLMSSFRSSGVIVFGPFYYGMAVEHRITEPVSERGWQFGLEQRTASPVLFARTELRQRPRGACPLSLLSVSIRRLNSDGYSY